VFGQIPTYGEKKVHEQLLKDGIKVSQYTSEVHTQRLKNLGITISMDGKGRATDNICIECFWRSAKCERIYLNEYQNINELTTDMDDYIEFYNYRRFH
jgi:putative transposase